MPALLDRLHKQLMSEGKSKDQSYALATSILEKNGYLKPGTQTLTAKGKIKQALPEWVSKLGTPKQRIKAKLKSLKK